MEIRYFGLEFYILTVYWGEKNDYVYWIGIKKMHIYKMTTSGQNSVPAKYISFFLLHKIGNDLMIFFMWSRTKCKLMYKSKNTSIINYVLV